MIDKTVNIQKSLSTMERIPKNPEIFYVKKFFTSSHKLCVKMAGLF